MLVCLFVVVFVVVFCWFFVLVLFLQSENVSNNFIFLHFWCLSFSIIIKLPLQLG